RTCALRLWVPVTQVINHPGEETRLGSSQQKSQDVESRRGPNKHYRHRDGAPAHHDPCDPTPRPHAMQNEIARHFEQAVAQEEHAGAEAERSRAKSEIGIHLKRRKTDVHSVEPRYDVENEQEWDQPKRDLAQGYRGNVW